MIFRFFLSFAIWKILDYFVVIWFYDADIYFAFFIHKLHSYDMDRKLQNISFFRILKIIN